ncbi:MAG: DUF565 domain-containing protein [Synechococcus sp.]|nr:DUF565 domain-containing protein [Synechococcus sp.]
MTRLPLRPTRWQTLQGGVFRQLRGALGGSWRSRSLALLALLGGFFLAQNVTTYLMVTVPGGRPLVVLSVVLGLELLVRLRTRLVGDDPSLGWVVLDNLRIGAVYAVVLEAFKLGS